jgi:hypothetical protein
MQQLNAVLNILLASMARPVVEDRTDVCDWYGAPTFDPRQREKPRSRPAAIDRVKELHMDLHPRHTAASGLPGTWSR